MITHIQGKMVEKNPDHVVVECNGLGYHIHISLQTFSNIPDQENLKLFTHLVIREDAHILFGFYSKTEPLLDFVDRFFLILTIRSIHGKQTDTLQYFN